MPSLVPWCELHTLGDAPPGDSRGRRHAFHGADAEARERAKQSAEHADRRDTRALVADECARPARCATDHATCHRAGERSEHGGVLKAGTLLRLELPRRRGIVVERPAGWCGARDP